MRKGLVRLGAEETGAVTIMVAVMLTVFVGFLAIVTDVGYMFEMRRQLQSAADAAALAAMTEKIQGGDPVAEARTYVMNNDLVGAPFNSDILDLANSDFTTNEDEVIVAVQKPANLFFAPAAFFGPDSQVVQAKAKARRVYLTGVKHLVPLGAITIRATGVQAKIGGTVETLTYNAGSAMWAGTLPSQAEQANGYPVDLAVTNSQGYVADYPNATRVVVDKSGDSVSDAYLSVNNLVPGATTTFRVISDADKVEITKPNMWKGDLTQVGGVWQKTLTAPSSLGLPVEAYSIDIKADQDTFANAAVVVVHTDNAPIEEINGPVHWSSSSDLPAISVKMRVFAYDQTYNLKVDSAQVGNFGALDFPGGSGADDYGEFLTSGYPGEIKIGQIVWTEPGGMAGKTKTGLENRFLSCPCGGCPEGQICPMTFSAWEDAGKPANCARVVAVPIVEQVPGEPIQGKTPLMVVDFAAFFVTSNPSDDVITGQFTGYTSVGTSQDTPPSSGMYVESVRLDRPDY